MSTQDTKQKSQNYPEQIAPQLYGAGNQKTKTNLKQRTYQYCKIWKLFDFNL